MFLQMHTFIEKQDASLFVRDKQHLGNLVNGYNRINMTLNWSLRAISDISRASSSGYRHSNATITYFSIDPMLLS